MEATFNIIFKELQVRLCSTLNRERGSVRCLCAAGKSSNVDVSKTEPKEIKAHLVAALLVSVLETDILTALL